MYLYYFTQPFKKRLDQNTGKTFKKRLDQNTYQILRKGWTKIPGKYLTHVWLHLSQSGGEGVSPYHLVVFFTLIFGPCPRFFTVPGS